MNADLMARLAYADHATPARTARGVEYDIFAKVTHALRSGGAEAVGRPALLAAALHDNLRLWTTLAADVAEPGNRLPAALRARIFHLAEFTRRHTSRVLAGDADCDVLTDINIAVMKGLRGGGDAQ